MLKKKRNIVILMIGILIVLITIIFNYFKNNNKQDLLWQIEGNNKNKQFAIYIEKDNKYIKYEKNTMPEYYKYVYNKSVCKDVNDKEVESKDIIKVNYDNSITVTSSKTIYCEIYFDEEFRGTGYELIESKTANLSSELTGGMHRYQGQASEVDNNYICFGTNNKQDCIDHPDKYMYRIIGIEENGEIKVIKKEALESGIKWWDDYNTDITFLESRINESINGTGFLENTTYVPNGWENKIADHTWHYGDMYNNSEIGARQTGLELYKIETGQKQTGWRKKEADDGSTGGILYTVTNNSTANYGKSFYYSDQSGYHDKTIDSKIYLMYLHDYYLSVSDEANCQYHEGKYSGVCNTGWMHLSQNGTTSLSFNEWTISRYGWDINYGTFSALYVDSSGAVNGTSLSTSKSIRPVFYLKSGIYFEGKGTSEEPYVIKESEAVEYIKNETPKGLSNKISGDMYRYQGQQVDNIENYICFGTSNKETCLDNQDKYMYRIIGIEAGTGRIKVIKKEALDDMYQWWNDHNTDITWPNSIIYQAINGKDFLNNTIYIPNSWKVKISDNSWIYGDMLSDSTVGARQKGSDLYLTETGQKATRWRIKVDANYPGAIEQKVTTSDSSHYGQTFYYIEESGKWNQTSKSKISLMYASDYYLSVSDEANCQLNENKYVLCQTGWIHFEQNNKDVLSERELTMTRYGWNMARGQYSVLSVFSDGFVGSLTEGSKSLVRPTFYINSNIQITSGTGEDTNPFIIE